MTGTRVLVLLAVVACCSANAVRCVAVPPFLSMFQKKPVEISKADLELKDESGPYLILATVLSGEDGQQKAIALAKELRETLGVQAYVHKKVFDTTTPSPPATYHLPGDEKPIQLRVRARNPSREENYAVLVGDFTEIDSPIIQSVLKKIKSAKPQVLAQADATTGEGQSVDSATKISQHRSTIWKLTNRKEIQQRGPMGAALITRNPLLPDEFFQLTPRDDKELKFVIDLNRDKKIEHSVLDCPGRYTVRVASFYGRSANDVGSGGKLSTEGEASDLLVHAALQSHKMTQALRKKGVEAFEYHDIYGSYVMIGSFDSLGESLSNGEFRYSPDILQVLEQYCGFQTLDKMDPITGRVQRVQSAKYIDKIPFDVDGKPLAVPRPAKSQLYGNSLLGRLRLTN